MQLKLLFIVYVMQGVKMAAWWLWWSGFRTAGSSSQIPVTNRRSDSRRRSCSRRCCTVPGRSRRPTGQHHRRRSSLRSRWDSFRLHAQPRSRLCPSWIPPAPGRCSIPTEPHGQRPGRRSRREAGWLLGMPWLDLLGELMLFTPANSDFIRSQWVQGIRLVGKCAPSY